MNWNKIFLYSKTISSLIEELYNDPNAAYLFCKAPTEYLESKNISSLIIGEEERRLLMAFSDKQIRNAIEKNDLKEFLKLAKEKQYIGVSSYMSPEKLRNYFASQQDYEQYLASPQEEFILAFGVAIYVGGVTITALAIINVLWAITETSMGISGSGGGGGGDDSGGFPEYPMVRNWESISEKEPVLKLWLNNTSKATYSVEVSAFINSQAEEIAEIYCEVFETVKKEEIQKIIQLNLESYYGLR